MASPAGGRKNHFLTFFQHKNSPKIDKNGLKMTKKRGKKWSKKRQKMVQKTPKNGMRPYRGVFFTF